MEVKPSAQSSSQKKFMSILAKDSLKIEIELIRSALFHMKTRAFLKYVVRACSPYEQLPDH